MLDSYPIALSFNLHVLPRTTILEEPKNAIPSFDCSGAKGQEIAFGYPVPVGKRIDFRVTGDILTGLNYGLQTGDNL
jgi:hypothetical protein